MRVCVLLLLLIAAAAAVGMSVDSGAGPEPPREKAAEKVWVRTVDGWEPLATLQAGARREPSRLHPFAVAGFQALGSALALVAFDRRR